MENTEELKVQVPLWAKVSKTDARYIKDAQQGLSSIDSYAMFKSATEQFGICGIGWGYDIVNEEYRDGGEIKKNGEVIGTEINHILKVKVWFKYDGKNGFIEHYGITRYMYGSKYGVTTDEEAPKKSLTDGIKKCLSMLGFSADVYMGKFEDADYKAGAEIRAKIEESDEREAEMKKQLEELDVWFKRELDTAKLIHNQTSYLAVLRKIASSVKTRCQACNVDPQQYVDQLTELSKVEK